MATRELAEFCSKFTSEDLTRNVIRKVKCCVIDFLGVALGGSVLSSSKIMVDLVRRLGGAPESTIISIEGKVSSPNAALANGVMAHGLELDDVHNKSSLHPGVSIISTAMALAEREKADGRTFATSIALGYEVTSRIGMAVTPSGHYGHGFHPTGTCGTFGAAVTAGKILGLNEDQLMQAMGIAGSQSAGSMEFLSDGSWTKRLHPGWAAHGGVIAALLAQRGYTGPTTILEGRNGFVRSYSDSYDLSKLTEGLGKELIVENIAIKPHACCRYKQSPIDAILELVKKYDIKPESVQEVVISVVKTAMPIIAEPLEIKYNPKTIVDAQFSMPYGAAVAILNRRAFVDEYTQNMIRDPRVLSLARKVKVVHDPQLDMVYPKLWPAKARIKTKDHKVYETRIDAPKGDPGNPLTNEELQEKFRILASKVLPEEKVKEIVRTTWNLEKIENINDLITFLYP